MDLIQIGIIPFTIAAGGGNYILLEDGFIILAENNDKLTQE